MLCLVTARYCSMIEVPCKNCQSRKFGCHSSCDKYKDFKMKMDKLNKARQLANDEFSRPEYQIWDDKRKGYWR